MERGGRIVLSDLGLTLSAGETVLVTGRNGAGKSTLLRTLSGLLPAQAGTIRYGLANDEVRGAETVHYLGYEDALKPSLSVGENLAFWASLLGRRSPVEAVGFGAAIAPPPDAPPGSHFAGTDMSPGEALEAFGMKRLIDVPAAYLSAGQKRRVALARLLLSARPVWLLDEPLIALDTGAQATLTARMTAHVADGGAILVASHQRLALPHRELRLGTGGEP